MTSRLFERLTSHIDSLLMGCLLFTLLVGLLVLYSASGQSLTKVNAQLVNIAIAIAIMLVTANIQPQILERLTPSLFIISILLLIGVALFGDVSHGARRWLNLGIIKIQPSELMHIVMPMMLAWYFSKRESSLSALDYLIAGIILFIPVMFIIKQPDLGTSLLVAASGFFVIFLAGLSWKFMITAAISAIGAAPILWSLLHDYQKRRIKILIDPTQDPLGSGYHIIQSTIAQGSGGLTGKGWLNGSQSQLDFLPERTTDFIFAVFSEEFGLIGNFLLLFMFGLIIFRGIVIASEAKSVFSRLLASSITLTFFTYAFVNIGMVSGILPVVGVPLPLLSYGGTSMVTILVGFGILMSIQTHKKLISSS